jgi:PAS domain S-box-containing protein
MNSAAAIRNNLHSVAFSRAFGQSSLAAARLGLVGVAGLAAAGSAFGLLYAVPHGAITGVGIWLLVSCLIFATGLLLLLVWWPLDRLAPVSCTATAYFGIYLLASAINAVVSPTNHETLFAALVWFIPLQGFNIILNAGRPARILAWSILAAPLLTLGLLWPRIAAAYPPPLAAITVVFAIAHVATAVLLQVLWRYRDAFAGEQERSASYRFAAEILESLSESFILVDRAFRLLYINRIAGTVMGVQPAEVQGRPLREAVPRFALPAMLQALKDGWSATGTGQFEICVEADGRWYEVRCTPRQDDMSVYFRDVTERRVMEEKLRQSELQLRIAGQLIRMGGWEYHLPDDRVIWSDQVAAIHGLPVGTSPSLAEAVAYFALKSRPLIREKMRQCLSDGTPYDVELQLVTATGQQLWVRAIGQATRDAQGVITGAQGAFQDISAHVEARREARHWADAIEHAGFGISLVDAASTAVIYANPAFAALRGMSREDVVGKKVLDFYPPAEHARVSQFRAEIESAGHVVYEADALHADGSVYQAMISVTYVKPADGAPPYRIGITLDISRIKAAEAQARREARRWADAVTHAGFGIAIIDAGTESVVYANAAFAAQHAMRMEELTGRPVLEFYAPAERSRVRALRADIETVGHLVYEADRLRPDGSEFPAIVSITHVRPEDGSPPYLICTMLDLSNIKTAEAQARQMQRLAMLGQMAAGLAHELNQPLAVVSMAAENAIELVEHGGSAAAVTKKLQRMLEQAGRATEIIRNVKMFGHRGSGTTADADVADAVGTTLSIVHNRLLTGGITVERALAADLPRVVLPPVQLEQVLTNLLVNAADAFAATGATARVIRIAAWRDGDEVALSVADTAGGIPAPVLERIFEPFFTTKPVGQGTGLGLSISYDIITGARGSMRARNQNGGAVFDLRLPAAPPAAAGPAARSPAAVLDRLSRGDGG